jgi:hypothetical protein
MRDGIPTEIICPDCTDWDSVISRGVYEPNEAQRSELGHDYSKTPVANMLRRMGVKFFKPPS